MSAVPADGDPPRRRRSLDKGRIESFSDGIFGFAATLLARGQPLDIPLERAGQGLVEIVDIEHQVALR